MLAGLPVILVILLFLRNLSATVIPSLALPISVIGTFAVMHALDYSLDNLSLLAFDTLGRFRRDDAIVMLESIRSPHRSRRSAVRRGRKGQRNRLHHHLFDRSPGRGLHPGALHEGIVGRLPHEFAVTICAAILSAIVSLTLTPMLCSRYLKHDDPAARSRFPRLERFFDRLPAVYERGR